MYYKNDDKNCNENNEQPQLPEGSADNCYKIVSPILLQELIKDFALCKHCSGILLVLVDNLFLLCKSMYILKVYLIHHTLK